MKHHLKRKKKVNHFYRSRHTSEEAREVTLKFLDLEDECDKHNMLMIQSMDIKGISKTNINKATSSFNLKHRDRVALRKRVRREALHSLGQDRTWIKSL